MSEQENQFEESSLSDNVVLAEAHSLGIAGRIARTFINTPVTPMLLVAAFAVGILGLIFTPRQEDPQISVPMIDLMIQYPGADAKQVTSLVTDPLERLMSEIPGVRHVYSATQRGQAIVTVRFKVSEDFENSIVKVHDKIQSNLDRMPPGVPMPLVKPVAIDDVPVITITLWSNDVDDGLLRTLSLDVLQKLGRVPNTGKGFVVGGRAEQLRVEVMTDRLAGFGVSLGQIANTIKSANSQTATGAVETGGASFNVYSGSFLRTVSEVERLVVGVHDGVPVYVRDVAKVSLGPEDPKSMVSFYTGPAYPGATYADGAAAVTIAIAKKQGTNGVVVAEAILAKLEELKGTDIPSNVHLDVTRDYGKSANDKVNELLGAMAEAAIIVSILCLVGLGARAAFVVIAVIPIVVLLTIWWAMMVDYTIDRVSLFALIFSIGILVDDATVVVENIFRHWLEKGRTSIADAIEAVREVGNPTILATFTIIAALLPMGWVSGLMGPYMRPIPVLGASAMFFSLIAAFIFTPWLALKVAPKLDALRKAEEREKKAHERIAKIYRPVIMPLVENRKLGVFFLVGIIALTAVLCILFYTQHVRVKMLPFDNKPEFSVVINMPEGTAMPVTANLAHQLAEKVRNISEVTAVVSYAGTAQPMNFNGMVRHYYLRQQPWEGDLLVLLKDKNDRKRGSHAIAEEARAMLTPIAKEAGARIAIVEMPPGPPVLNTLVAEVYNPDPEIRRQFARELAEIFEAQPNIVDVDTYVADDYNYWRFEVDTEKAVRRGISVDTINGTLAMAMGGYRLGDIKTGASQEPTYIVMQVPLAIRSQINRLGNLPIPTADGFIPLAELGEFIQEPEDPIEYHKDLQPVEYVVAEGGGPLGAPLYGLTNVENALQDYSTPDGYSVTGNWEYLLGLLPKYGPPYDTSKSSFEWTGEWTVTHETFRDMCAAFMGAMVLIYGLIVWEFRNFAIAGLIMAPIPLTMIGIIPGHWIMNAEFTATSMIGMIALGGIIVRQSILIVEFVKIGVAKGLEVREAAVRGAEIRMRPIFITSLTLMAGAFAIIDDPIFQGMAVSLLFGGGVATIMALLVIPLGCISCRRQFYLEANDRGEMTLSADYARIEGEDAVAEESARQTSADSGSSLWGKLVAVGAWVFYLIRGVFVMIWQGILAILGMVGIGGSAGGTPPPPRAPGQGGSAPPSGGGSGPPPRAPLSEEAIAAAKEQADSRSAAGSPATAPAGGGSGPPPRAPLSEEALAKAKADAESRSGATPAPAAGTAPPPRAPLSADSAEEVAEGDSADSADDVAANDTADSEKKD